MKKILIIRFSSFGDIIQCMYTVSLFKKQGFEVHWLVRNDMAEILNAYPEIDQVHSFDKSLGLWGLIKMALELKKENWTHVYDAHNNLRSLIVSKILKWNFNPFQKKLFYKQRSKFRFKRFLLFKLGINTFPKPFIGANSFIEPIQSWVNAEDLNSKPHLNLPPNASNDRYICLAPSAAWPLKRWPIESWVELIHLLPDKKFIVLGGPKDDFCYVLQQKYPQQVTNKAGALSWVESASYIQKADLVISGDTGLLHLADFLAVPSIALMGASAFGYPKRKSSYVLTLNLPCQPCSKDGRGRCKNKVYLKCLNDIKATRVAQKCREMLAP